MIRFVPGYSLSAVLASSPILDRLKPRDPRAAAVALVVATVTTASHWIGSLVSGMFAVFVAFTRRPESGIQLSELDANCE
jgi:hypothetical protein